VAALLSAARDRPLPADAVFFGEVGLAGEVRSVSRPEARLAEARELGFSSAYVPATTARNLRGPAGPELVAVQRLSDLWEALDG
jgi:DNA repair protein RadA/Sms